MEQLKSFDFKKPSRSRYADAVDAVVDGGVFAVRLRRGEDFPEGVSMNSVQGAVADQIRKRGGRARTFRESEDSLVVSLWKNGEGPRRPARRGRQSRYNGVPAAV